MSILLGQGLSKYYGAQDIFAGVEFALARGDKTALVGPNGVGKTTLLRIILGLEEPSSGSVHKARGLRVGYLPQKPVFASQQTLYAEMLSVYAGLVAQQQQLLALADELATAPDFAELLERYAIAEQRFELAGGYTYEQRIQRVLSGLGFAPSAYEWPIATLSGGQVTRALLAKLLLEEPELLVLDEPTNYLDLEALEWLESYLQSWPHSLLVVSHDRYFLDKVVTRIWELTRGRLAPYRGNYSAYLQQRAAQRLRQQREYEEQSEFVARTEEFIRRNKAGQLSKQARGRETRLNRMERVEAPESDGQIHLQLDSRLRSGDNVLASEGALIGYDAPPGEDPAQVDGGYVLLNTGEFLIRRGQRVALLGPNGAGKTTLLRTILGELPPLEGRIRIGASVRIGYLPQNQAWLDGEKTVLEQILDAANLTYEQARGLMGRFLFGDEDVDKKVEALSGGERSRLALALLTLKGANLLVLDEPTTHLDLDSQEILQDVLQQFDGTIVFVSHDRYLVDALATHVWLIQGGGLRQFKGNYSSYLAELERERTSRAEEADVQPKEEREEQRRRERQVERAARKQAERTTALEDEIARIERQLAALSQQLNHASSAQDLARVQRLGQEYQTLETLLAERMAEWEELADLDQGGV